jgi:hypothetical protein
MVAFFWMCLNCSSHRSAESNVSPRYVAVCEGLTSIFPMIADVVVLNFVLDRVKWTSWYFAGENLDPCLLAHSSARRCARSKMRQFCSVDMLLVKK